MCLPRALTTPNQPCKIRLCNNSLYKSPASFFFRISSSRLCAGGVEESVGEWRRVEESERKEVVGGGGGGGRGRRMEEWSFDI